MSPRFLLLAITPARNNNYHLSFLLLTHFTMLRWILSNSFSLAGGYFYLKVLIFICVTNYPSLRVHTFIYYLKSLFIWPYGLRAAPFYPTGLLLITGDVCFILTAAVF